MCCTRLAASTGCKKVAKNRHLGTIAQLCRAISSQLRHVSTIGKNLLSSNISSTCPHNMVNFGPLILFCCSDSSRFLQTVADSVCTTRSRRRCQCELGIALGCRSCSVVPADEHFLSSINRITANESFEALTKATAKRRETFLASRRST